MSASGGCFCGAVRYRIEVDPIFVNACHCRDCQKLGGSAFALNGMIEAGSVAVTKGDVATHAGEARCAACQTMIWAEHPMFGEAIRFVRLGTLDNGERFPPDAHFFVRSRHAWVALADNLPRFETLPGEDDPPLFSPQQQARVDAAMARR